MLAGQLYDPSNVQLTALRMDARLKLETLNQTSMAQVETRQHLIKQLLGSSTERIHIESPFHCDYGENIHVGDNFYTNFGCVILDVAEVRIGKNCFIGPQVGIYTATHPLDPVKRANGLEYAKPITIGDDCWLGGHVTINPGVTLGNNVIVGAGSVVTKSFADNLIIAGNPARVIKTNLAT
ncbi:sugar O-acetyltransferase [Catenovulum sp. SM1970]|nr:sugar O-acetyltransferase [Marinifaba aquimaris]NTS76301.1 sugar O-acetyltransferase [Marinifaba aquimaris]